MLPFFLLALESSDICDPVTNETALAIYEGARTRWTTSTYAYDVHYVVHIASTHNGRTSELRYAGHARPSLGTFAVDGASVEERAAPTTPHGINFGIALGGATVVNLSAPLPTYDTFGIPELTPVYSFGLIRQQPRPNVGSGAPNSRNSEPNTIARVAATQRTYDVSCLDSSLGDNGLRMDHLRLVPLRAPNDNRVRELWVESGSYWTIEAKIARNFVNGPALTSSWIVDFDHDGNGERIRDERALAPLDFGQGKRYENLTISFEMTPPPPRSALDTFFYLNPQRPAERTLREP